MNQSFLKLVDENFSIMERATKGDFPRIPEGYPWNGVSQILRESYIDQYLDAGGSEVLHLDIETHEDYLQQLGEIDSCISNVYSDNQEYFSQMKKEVIRVYGPRFVS